MNTYQVKVKMAEWGLFSYIILQFNKMIPNWSFAHFLVSLSISTSSLKDMQRTFHLESFNNLGVLHYNPRIIQTISDIISGMMTLTIIKAHRPF